MSNREAREEIKASILLHNYYYICFKFFLFLSLQSLKINFKKNLFRKSLYFKCKKYFKLIEL